MDSCSTSRIKAVILFSIIVFQGCVSLKSTEYRIIDSFYVCDKGPMTGKTTLLLRDSTFVYKERDGLFIGGGSWQLSIDGKYVLLKGSTTFSYVNHKESDLRKELSLKLKIKGRDRLIGNDCIFIRQE